jgi:uncharacterized protein (DUF885 family)
LALALSVLDGLWLDMREGPYIRRDLGVPIDRLPDIGEAAAIARSERASDLLERANAIDPHLLPRDVATSLGVARFTLERMAREGEWYWNVFDPLGGGFFAMFAPCAYGGGFLLKLVAGMVAQHGFARQGDLDRYLGLVEDYARLVDQMRERTDGQAERGIRMPRLQLDQAIELIGGLSRAALSTLLPAADRLANIGGEAALARIEARIQERVAPAFERLLACLTDEDYRARAPEAVGMSQYPGGAEIYAELVRQHTNLDLAPVQVHEIGLARIARIRSEMDELLKETGFGGSPQDYLSALAADPAWRAEGAAEIGAFFQRYILRIEPHIEDYFDFKPKAPHGVDALPQALAGSMTFGYYDAPNSSRETGLYLFNAQNLAGNAMANIAALNYHELVPGHHFHIASQRENQTLHPIRAHAFVNAFNEGWAEYAATLAGEMGMYEETPERFGRLMMDSFLTTRLVVDTGMNALGWSLKEARDYMRANAFMPEVEIRSESLRYSCDIPGQALAYKLGEDFLVEQREAMRRSLGKHFDIREFHDAVLMPGALPLPLVADNVAHRTRELAARQS